MPLPKLAPYNGTQHGTTSTPPKLVQSGMSWINGVMSSSDIINGSDCWFLQDSAKRKWSCFRRIRLIHFWRIGCIVSAGRGIVQFAELQSPAPFVIRGPREIGFLERRLRHRERSWLNDEDCETQGFRISTIADASDDGYSAVSELTKVPLGSLLPLKSMWSRCWHCPANIEILSEVAAIAHVLKISRPHLQAGVATI